MTKELLTEAVSYKRRGVKAGGQWLEASRDFDIKEAVIGQIQKYEISETMDGKYIIHRILS